MDVSDWFTNRKRVRIALALKNIDYKYIPVNLLKAEQLDSEYTGKFLRFKERGSALKKTIMIFLVAQNPMGQVPTLCFLDEEGKSHVLTQVTFN